MRSRLAVKAIVFAFLLAAGAAAAASPAAPEAFLGVRVLKVGGTGPLKWTVKLPSSCPTCQLVLSEAASGQNPREFYFHIIAPAGSDILPGVHITVDARKVRSVLVGRSSVQFSKVRDGIEFDMPRNGPMMSDLHTFPVLPANAPGDVTELYTYIDSPGVETRVEHADEQRRNGPYAKGDWPSIQKQAALNLEFAARDAIGALGLDKAVHDAGLGTILLMGFDTNTPTLTPTSAHDDHPPHWHMHISWSHEPVIRQVGHLYIGPDGLLTENLVGDVVTNTSYLYKRGQTHQTKTAEGEVVYEQTITPEGYFIISSARGSCRLTPIAAGFQSGVELDCNNSSYHARVRADDDVTHGQLRVYLNDQVLEEHSYNPDNGVLKAAVLQVNDGSHTR